MSKKSRASRKLKRQAEKRAKKQAMKARYAAFRDAGITKGSKRARARAGSGLRTKRVRGAVPFPFHLFLDDSGNMVKGAPHKAFLAWRASLAE